MVFGELYRNGADWKFRAVGQGYASGPGGHRPRLRRQRLTVAVVAIDYNKRPSRRRRRRPGRPRAAAGGVSLSKVTLTKSAPSVSLTKRGAAGGQLRVNLQWSTGAARRSQEGPVRPADRRAAAGSTSTWPACGSSPTAARAWCRRWATRSRRPTTARRSSGWTATTARGRSAAARTCSSTCPGSNEIRRILVFAFIYEGVPNWASADGVVTLYPAGRARRSRCGSTSPTRARPTCVIAMLENKGGELVVRREVRYIRGGQADVDAAYGWGMEWARGRKWPAFDRYRCSATPGWLRRGGPRTCGTSGT